MTFLGGKQQLCETKNFQVTLSTEKMVKVGSTKQKTKLNYICIHVAVLIHFD